MERAVRRRRRAQGQGGGRHRHRGRAAGGRRPGPCRHPVPAPGGAHAAAPPRPRRCPAADTGPEGRVTGATVLLVGAFLRGAAARTGHRSLPHGDPHDRP
ncbi:hypothetical protein SCOCK_350083 [Actinacidiphila cocklensis]|uniref:Uncharacterized protein n=1 Tax=Actinacidiphila cocklensis TaxID=887465 RepID=A0A9W4GUI5_9ACTN|nr:hypothetical protein SCOCK_350083 [Actinacidiphila cocklensis]